MQNLKDLDEGFDLDNITEDQEEEMKNIRRTQNIKRGLKFFFVVIILSGMLGCIIWFFNQPTSSLNDNLIPTNTEPFIPTTENVELELNYQSENFLEEFEEFTSTTSPTESQTLFPDLFSELNQALVTAGFSNSLNDLLLKTANANILNDYITWNISDENNPILDETADEISEILLKYQNQDPPILYNQDENEEISFVLAKSQITQDQTNINNYDVKWFFIEINSNGMYNNQKLLNLKLNLQNVSE